MRTLLFEYAGSRPQTGVYPCYPDQVKSTNYFSANWTLNGQRGQYRVGCYVLRTLTGDLRTAWILESGRHYTIQVQID